MKDVKERTMDLLFLSYLNRPKNYLRFNTDANMKTYFTKMMLNICRFIF